MRNIFNNLSGRANKDQRYFDQNVERLEGARRLLVGRPLADGGRSDEPGRVFARAQDHGGALHRKRQRSEITSKLNSFLT